MIFVREHCKPISTPSATRLQRELAFVRSSFASLTHKNGSYVQVAGGPGLFLLEQRDPTGHRRAFQAHPVAPHPDGTTLECSAGSIPMNRTDWFLRDQVAEVFLAFSVGRTWPPYVQWRECEFAKHFQDRAEPFNREDLLEDASHLKR
jgi:hypothetical protein